MKKILLIGAKTTTGKLLSKAFLNHAMLIEPDVNLISFCNGMAYYNGNRIDDADVLMIRAMPDVDIMYGLACMIEKNGGIVIDGTERIKRNSLSKLASSLERSSWGGINTIIGIPDRFPVIVKPKDGKYCRGVEIINSKEEWDNLSNPNNYVVQEYIPFEYENRVLVLNIDHVDIIYIASKKNVARKGTKRKATFVPDKIKKSLTEFVLSDPYVQKRKGLIGYDIGTLNMNHYIIEANYSPRFDRAVVKINDNIPEIIVTKILTLK